jgi:hypothetical protein
MMQRILAKGSSNWPGIYVNSEVPIDLYVDSVTGFTQNSNYKILWVKEVEEISHFASTALKWASRFDLILTYDQRILEKCTNSVMFEFGTCWVFDYDLNSDKKFSISHLTGNKRITEGHRLRQEVYRNQNLITNPIDFYLSSRGSIENTFFSENLGESKSPLFNSQFHICIENSRQTNLFTEKLIDCLYTKTVPIFYGCDNIGDYFDTRGFFRANTLNEIIEVCNTINQRTYQDLLEYVEINYEKSKKYINLLERLEDVIQKQISKIS